MPPLTRSYAAPPSLATVIGQVRDAFDEMGDATPIMVGKGYLEQGVGAAPRVLFVPEQKGKIGPPLELGNSASISHGCDVYVRAEESGDELTRFAKAEELAALVIDCIKTAATGRVEFGEYSDGSPLDVDGLGAELAFSFTYTRDLRHSAARWALPAATASSASPTAGRPPGQPAAVDDILPTVTPVEA